MATGNWAYAVPLDETNGYVQSQWSDSIKSQNTPRASSQHPPRNVSAQRKADDWDVRSDSGAVESRRISNRQSNMSVASRKRSRNTLRDKANLQTPAASPPIGLGDDSAWIHRDKLAQIEIQEMAEAGFHIRPSRRSTSAGPLPDSDTRSQSRNESRRPRSRQRDSQDVIEATTAPQLDEHTGQQYASFDDYANKKRVSTIPAGDEEAFDFGRAADAQNQSAEDAMAGGSYRQHVVRPSTSRIPVSKVSASPMPQQVVDRDAPLPRSRSGSGAWGGNWDETQYERRARSNSVGSQNLLDNAEGTPTSPRGATDSPVKENNSPPKSRLPNRVTPTSRARKPSGAANGTNNTNGNRSGSVNGRPTSSHKKSQPSKRPGSSGGPRAPEGEPPWLANMYKPDPRLPPDQQMLPTHAKRIMQEQWEKEGKSGTAYDREFRLMNDEDMQFRSTPSPHSPYEQNDIHELEAPVESHLNVASSPNLNPASPVWPLTPTSDTSQRPSTSGGYKITPTITSPPTFQQRSTSPVKHVAATAPVVMEPHKPTPRVPDLDEKHEATPKKGCCCVMIAGDHASRTTIFVFEASVTKFSPSVSFTTRRREQISVSSILLTTAIAFSARLPCSVFSGTSTTCHFPRVPGLPITSPQRCFIRFSHWFLYCFYVPPNFATAQEAPFVLQENIGAGKNIPSPFTDRRRFFVPAPQQRTCQLRETRINSHHKRKEKGGQRRQK
nr:hypothetical protein CFP56_65199 [Quercus suber]